VIVVMIVIHRRQRTAGAAGETRRFLRERQERFALRVAEAVGMLAQEKDDKGENEAEAHRDRERDDWQGE
jgi:hypothetical protein